MDRYFPQLKKWKMIYFWADLTQVYIHFTPGINMRPSGSHWDLIATSYCSFLLILTTIYPLRELQGQGSILVCWFLYVFLEFHVAKALFDCNPITDKCILFCWNGAYQLANKITSLNKCYYSLQLTTKSAGCVHGDYLLRCFLIKSLSI